jgi:methanogenic corrinoid protein MtbC1
MLHGVSPLAEQPLSRHLDAFCAALQVRDARRARATIDAALADGVGLDDVYLGLFQPALYAIGDLWACEDATVADEHFAAALVSSLMGEIGPRMRVDPVEGRLAVLACTPGEHHDLGLRMVRDLLQSDGWEVIHLGAATPAADLAALVAEECPDAVVLSTTTAGRLPGVEEALRALAEVRPSPIIVVGGQFWTAEAASHAADMGADVVVRDARLLAPRLDKLARRQA